MEETVISGSVFGSFSLESKRKVEKSDTLVHLDDPIIQILKTKYEIYSFLKCLPYINSENFDANVIEKIKDLKNSIPESLINDSLSNLLACSALKTETSFLADFIENKINDEKKENDKKRKEDRKKIK